MIKLLDNVCLVQNKVLANYTQEAVLVGKVIDAELFEGMCGVKILQKGTTNGTITDLNGNYQIKLKAVQFKLVLVYSFEGYITKEIEVPQNVERINVILYPSPTNLSVDSPSNNE